MVADLKKNSYFNQSVNEEFLSKMTRGVNIMELYIAS